MFFIFYLHMKPAIELREERFSSEYHLCNKENGSDTYGYSRNVPRNTAERVCEEEHSGHDNTDLAQNEVRDVSGTAGPIRNTHNEVKHYERGGRYGEHVVDAPADPTRDLVPNNAKQH